MTDQYVDNPVTALGDAYLAEYDVQSEQDLVLSIMSTTYSLELLEGWYLSLQEIAQADYTHESSTRVCRLLGRRVEKLKLYKSNVSFVNYRHLAGTILFCIQLINDGYCVHLLESISVDGIKKMNDIDVFASKESSITLFDYTQLSNRSVRNYKDLPGKLEILSHKFLNVSYEYEVVSCTLPDVFWNMTFGSETSLYGNYVKDFQSSSHMLDLVMKFNHGDCVEVLKSYSDNIREGSRNLPTKLIRNLPKGNRRLMENFPKYLRMIARNDVEAAKQFEYMRFGLSSPSCRSKYSLDHFERYESCMEKPVYNVPLADRNPGLVKNNPFERLRQIEGAHQDLFQLTNPLITLLHLAEDGELHPSKDEIIRLERNPKYFKYRGIEVKRVKHKNGNELVNAVRIFFNGEIRSLEALAFGDSKSKPLISQSRTEKQCHSFVELEEKFRKEKDWCEHPFSGSRYFDEIDPLIDNVMPNSATSDLIRESMRSTLNLFRHTRLGSMISFQQEIATAVCNSPRKKKISKSGHDGFAKRTCVVSLDCVTDRFAVAITNMSSLLNTNKNQTVSVAGVYNTQLSAFSRGHEQGLSEWFNYSAADLDWHVTLTHKLISWLALEIEEVLINEKKPTKKSLVDLLMFPSMIMTINDQKFAQASEMVRYIFVNSTGISGGTSNLYDKIAWYSPTSPVAKLYMMRMIKMSTGVQWVKTYNRKSELLVQYSSDLNDGVHMNKHFNFKHWAIAFPHENKFVPSDVHTYNSFYICKTFTVQRHNRLMSESQVVLKQLEARRAYLSIVSENREHELRFVPFFSNKKELKDWLNNLDYINMKVEAFSPSPAVVLLGGLATLLRTHKEFSHSLGNLVATNYLCADVPRNMRVSDILNNHGSVSSMGAHGLVVSNVSSEIRDGKTIHVFNNQNSKCYITVLNDIHDFVCNLKPKAIPEDWAIVEPELQDMKKILDESVLHTALRESNMIWPLVARHVFIMTQFVSKMTHKDQIGSREIATLNAAARICCYYVEEFSRYIRDTEHKHGMHTDLIERRDKEDIVKSAFNKSRISAQEGKTVIYDSADCSKWGPSMLSPILYLSLGLRVHDTHIRETIMRCLHLFSNKVFKLPDALYLSTNLEDHDEESTNAVSEARNEVKNMTWPLGDPKLQIINLPESMHQGILGVTSSLLATDAQNLSRHVVMAEYAGQVVVEPFITSDDYSRILTFSNVLSDEESLSSLVKRSLQLHVAVSNGFGIKRNMEKSTHSTVVLEFNSVFHTPSSENKPDIKSRLSYVDFGQSYDPYPNALECLVKGSEFLRSEGSLHGACWIQTLNTHLSMMQNQSINLFQQLGSMIFSVPLELGGFPKIDPVAAVMSSKHMPLMDNYNVTMDFNPKDAMRIMMDLKPDEVEEISLDPEDAIRSRVPKLSRSGMIHLCRRDKKTSRKVREFIGSIPRPYFTDLRFPGSKYSLLPSLLACMQREETVASGESASVRYSVPQTPMDALIYRSNSRLLKTWFSKETLLSRREIQTKAIWFASEKVSPTGVLQEYLRLSRNNDIPFFYDNMLAERHVYLTRLAQIKPTKIVAVNKRTHSFPLRDTFVPSMWFEQATTDFNREFKPEELGGTSTISPQLFLESVMMFRAKMQDLVSRKQVLKLTLMEMDATTGSVLEKILLGAFMNGGRLLYDKQQDSYSKTVIEDNVGFLIKMLSNNEWKHQWSIHGNINFDILDQRVLALIKTKRVAWLNLTNLLNATMNTSEHLSFSDTRSKMEIWHALYESTKDFTRTPFSIDPQCVNLNASHEVFQLGGLSKIYSQPVRFTGDRVVGKEIIQEKVNGVHNHYYVMTQDVSYTIPDDGPNDHYEMRDISTLDNLPVTMKNIGGFLMLVTPDGYPIQVLCSAMPEVNNNVFIHFGRYSLNKEIINRLGLNDPYSGLSDSMKKILTSKMQLYHEESEPVTEVAALVEEVNDLRNLLEFGDAQDEDGGFDFDMDDLLNALEQDDSQLEEFEGRGLNDALFDESGAELDNADNESESSSFFASSSEVGSYISAYGVFHPTSTLLSTKAYGQLSLVPQSLRRTIPGAVRTERTMSFNLPFKTKKDVYDTGPTGTGLTELLDELSNQDDVDATWFVTFIRDCIVSSGFVMAEVPQVMAEGESEEEW